MPVPTLVSQLSTTANSNSPSGADAPSVIDDHQRAAYSFIALHRDGAGFSQEAAVASASTADIGAASSFYVQITGTTTITSFGTNYNGPRLVRFADVLTLTHNASTLILPTGANITTAAGDRAILTPVGNPSAGWQVLAYQRANGRALAETSTPDYLNTTRIDVASASTVDLTANAPNTRNINITGTTTITAFTVAIGQLYFVRFNASLTLTNNASIVTQTGASIVTSAGDTCILRATAANTVEVLSYVGQATATKLGIVELATNAEAQTGTDTVRAVTPANLGATVPGMSQTWQNLSASRAVNTDYNNSTGRTIVFSVRFLATLSQVGAARVGGLDVSQAQGGDAGGTICTVSAVVPPGTIYSFRDLAGSTTGQIWFELR